MSELIRLLVVDDHQVVREGIVSLIAENPDFLVCGEASQGLEAIKLMETLTPRPEIVLMDIHMPVMDGIDCTRELVNRYGNEVSVLALTMVKQGMYVRKILQAGAQGYLLKDCDKFELYDAIKCLWRGETYFSPAVGQVIVGEMMRRPVGAVDPALVTFTPREKEVLSLIIQDKSNAEIADKLSISVRTVETHKQNLLNKSGVNSVAGLVVYAIRHKIVDVYNE